VGRLAGGSGSEGGTLMSWFWVEDLEAVEITKAM